jgi:molybdopterin-guanine dinucleotide biosynthesis protein B
MGALSEGRIIGIVGWKDTGKTQVVERLVAALNAKGFTVGTVKHVHDEIALEPEAKDSTRHLGAGAVCTVMIGPGLSVAMKRGDEDLEAAMARYLSLCDYVVVEGFKHADIPKVAVVADKGEPLDEIENIVAVISKGDGPEAYPAFTLEEVEKLGQFLLDRGILQQPARGTSLLVNGEPVSLNDFVQSSLSGVIQGFLASLRDIEKPTTIELNIKT